ncbi:MAG: GAF domain-containing protein [Phycisphaerae bacterium]|nr:GAF domain-containing protein [Phycisphaerae bacterium]MCZ2400695.1 GAF domain-containing protein [Phycisphaerae bacterium]NUQ50375.1 GAF domain-containing protein [Phycisphaerae bacterium]
MPRPYASIVEELRAAHGEPSLSRVVDALWEGLRETGVSWAGFYLHESGEELVLGPSRDKPACTPIGLHGACGRAFVRQRPLVVRDVRDLGEGYIACDPRDRSEVVVPLVDASGACRGVLDLDSFEVGSFDDGDVRGLITLLRAAGLTAQPADTPPEIV